MPRLQPLHPARPTAAAAPTALQATAARLEPSLLRVPVQELHATLPGCRGCIRSLTTPKTSSGSGTAGDGSPPRPRPRPRPVVSAGDTARLAAASSSVITVADGQNPLSAQLRQLMPLLRWMAPRPAEEPKSQPGRRWRRPRSVPGEDVRESAEMLSLDLLQARPGRPGQCPAGAHHGERAAQRAGRRAGQEVSTCAPPRPLPQLSFQIGDGAPVQARPRYPVTGQEHPRPAAGNAPVREVGSQPCQLGSRGDAHLGPSERRVNVTHTFPGTGLIWPSLMINRRTPGRS
jgi:hypothetical protein